MGFSPRGESPPVGAAASRGMRIVIRELNGVRAAVYHKVKNASPTVADRHELPTAR